MEDQDITRFWLFFTVSPSFSHGRLLLLLFFLFFFSSCGGEPSLSGAPSCMSYSSYYRRGLNQSIYGLSPWKVSNWSGGGMGGVRWPPLKKINWSQAHGILSLALFESGAQSRPSMGLGPVWMWLLLHKPHGHGLFMGWVGREWHFHQKAGVR